MAGKVKKIITAILLLGAIGATAGLYMWNKPHEDVAAAKGLKTTATVLYQSFISDSVSAKKKFIQQVVEVTGVIGTLSKNQQNQSVVLVKTGTTGAYINCTMEGIGAGIKEGDTIEIKGICDGIGQGDPELGIMGDVYLVRCYLSK